MFSAQDKTEFMTEIAAQQLVAAVDPERHHEAKILQALAVEPDYIEPVMIGSIASLSTDVRGDLNFLTASIKVPSRERLFDFIKAVVHPQGRLTESMRELTGDEIGKDFDDIIASARQFCDGVSESLAPEMA